MSSSSTNGTLGLNPYNGLALHYFAPMWPAIVCIGFYYVVFFALFLWRRNMEPIRSRGWPMVVASTIAAFIFLVFDTIDFDFSVFAFGIDVIVPCYQDNFISGLVLEMWFFPLFYRMYLLYVKFRLNDDGLKSHDKDVLNSWIHRFKWTLTTKAFFVMYAVVFVFSFVVISAIMWGENMPAQPMFDLGIVNCAGDIFIYVAAVGAVEFLLIIFFVYLLWNVRDAFAFKYELMILLVTLFPIFILWAISSIDGLFSSGLPNLIMELVMIGICFTTSVVYPFILTFNPIYNSAAGHDGTHSSTDMSSDFDRNSITQAEYHEPGTLRFFVDLLDDPVMSEEFKQFCVELWCVENCTFFYAALQFAEAGNQSIDTQIKMAKNIYDRYIKPGAPHEINIEAAVRERIQELLQQAEEVGDIQRGIFSEAQKKVFLIMKTDTYKKFLQSSRFFNCFLSSPLGLAGGDNAVAYIQAHKPLFVNNLIPNNVISTVRVGKKPRHKSSQQKISAEEKMTLEKLSSSFDNPDGVPAYGKETTSTELTALRNDIP